MSKAWTLSGEAGTRDSMASFTMRKLLSLSSLGTKRSSPKNHSVLSHGKRSR